MKRRTFLKVFGIGIGAGVAGPALGSIEFEQELPKIKPDNQYVLINGSRDFSGKPISDPIGEGGFLVPKNIADQLIAKAYGAKP